LLDARGLRADEIAHLFSSRTHAAETVNGARAISPAQARKLAGFFHVTPELFFDDAQEPRKAAAR
jgi:antitoxin component HigA of HigAB toxin-antitoxin module